MTAWIELKHQLIGYQKETKYDAKFYFGDKSSVGIKPDVEKLAGISNGGFLLILTTENPGINDWTTGVSKFNEKFYPLRIKSLTNPEDFPSFYYLGLLEVIQQHLIEVQLNNEVCLFMPKVLISTFNKFHNSGRKILQSGGRYVRVAWFML